MTKKKRKIKIVEAGGSPYETGYQYGAACPEIKEMLEMTRGLFGGKERTAKIIRQYIPNYLPAAEKYAPEAIEEMKGMAAGAKVEFNDIMFLNITYEISVPDIMGGCTAFAAAGKATRDGSVIAGQNFDYIDKWEPYIILLKMSPDKAPRFMAVTAAGCLGLFGFNSSGLTINLNLLKDKASFQPAGGVPTHVILRKLFSCENIGETISAIAGAEGRAAKNYLVTSAQGDIIDIETTTSDMDIQYPENGILTHANNFKADRFKSHDLAPLMLPDAFIRTRRLYNLMLEHHGELSAEVMQKLLRDHNNLPDAICDHQNPKALFTIGKMLKTLVSIISCPGQQKAYITYGNPCENDYVEYGL
jgi:isopenicillin-N N-acyltransferase like protein